MHLRTAYDIGVATWTRMIFAFRLQNTLIEQSVTLSNNCVKLPSELISKGVIFKIFMWYMPQTSCFVSPAVLHRAPI